MSAFIDSVLSGKARTEPLEVRSRRFAPLVALSVCTADVCVMLIMTLCIRLFFTCLCTFIIQIIPRVDVAAETEPAAADEPIVEEEFDLSDIMSEEVRRESGWGGRGRRGEGILVWEI